jgi:hypothetical protein
LAQPSGRILGLPAKYRTYVRCSPLICAADSLSIFVHFILYLTAFPLKDAIVLLIHQRFGDAEKDDDAQDEERIEEGIQAIKKLTFIRWLFFIFGTLGPGIKLMAMEGVPWTKAWGAMFLASFLVVEGLVVVSWIYMPHEHHELLPGSPDANKLLRFKLKLKTIDGYMLAYSVLFYAWVLLWVVVDIHDALSPSPFQDPPPPPWLWWAPPPWLWWAPFHTVLGICIMGAVFLVPPLLLAIVLLIIWPGPIVRVFFDKAPETYGIKTELALRLYLTLALVLTIPSLSSKLIVMGLIVWALALVLVLPGLIIYLYLRIFAESYPIFSRSLFITWESSVEKREREQKNRGARDGQPDLTFPCFAMFLYSTILCVVWYWYRYNPEGTVNRGWTSVFG